MEKFQIWLKDYNFSENSIRTYIYNVKNFLDFMDNSATSIASIKNYFKEIHNKYEPNTLKLKLEAIKIYLKFKKSKIQIKMSEICLPKIQNKYFDILNINEFKQLSEYNVANDYNINLRNDLILKVLFYTGIRISEVSNLQWKNISNNMIKVLGKGNKIRYVFIKESILTKLFKLSQQSDFVFTKKNGEKLSVKRISTIIFKKVKGCNLNKTITAHSFRRTFATSMINKGANLSTVQKLLGHSKIETTAKYIHSTYEYIHQEYIAVFGK